MQIRMGVLGLMALCSALVQAASAEEQTQQWPSAREMIVQLHAEGVQIYECRAATGGLAGWEPREPVATLFENGLPVGRHFAGPTWELNDGSAVAGKVTARAPGAKPADVPLLWLEVISRRGSGHLSEAAAIERLNTKGGVAQGACSETGALLSVPYSADYAFLRRTN